MRVPCLADALYSDLSHASVPAERGASFNFEHELL